MRPWLILMLCGGVAGTGEMQETRGPIAADLVLVNGKIWTVAKDRPEVEALAVWRDRSLAVGTTAEIQRLAGAHTRLIDLEGRRVVPGFHDSHVHLLGAGLQLSQVALKDAR